MDLVLDYAALERNRAAAMALRVLEAAIERKLGFPVSIRQVACWASPTLMEEERTPERFVRLDESGRQQEIPAELQMALMAPVPVEQIRSAKQMIADRRARLKAAKA